MKDSNFVFENVDLLYYSLHKTTLKRGGSYIKSPEWLMNKRATINPKSTDNMCFRDAIVASLNYEDIPSHPERTSNLMPFFLINIIGRGYSFHHTQKIGKKNWTKQ